MDAGVAPREEALCASVAELLAPPDGVLALSAGRCSRIAMRSGVHFTRCGKTCARCHKAVPSQQTSARNAAPPAPPRPSLLLRPGGDEPHQAATRAAGYV